jgi:hypothetical protein
MKFAPWWYKVACGMGLVAATAVLPILGAVLAILGFLLTGIYLYGTWMAIKMLSSMVVNEAKTLPALTSFFIVLGFKVPFFLLLGLWLREEDLRTQSCFLIGLVLVYFWVVAWALSRGNAADPNNGHS